MQNTRRLKFSIKIYFYRNNVNPCSLSLLSSVPLFIFLSQLCFLLFYVGLALSHFLLCTFFVLLFLSLSLYILGTLSEIRDRRRRKTEDEERLKKKKDKKKSRTEVNIEVSWWIADLRTDQLDAFRVNSKRDTLEWCMYDKCSVQYCSEHVDIIIIAIVLLVSLFFNKPLPSSVT